MRLGLMRRTQWLFVVCVVHEIRYGCDLKFEEVEVEVEGEVEIEGERKENDNSQMRTSIVAKILTIRS